ncbi:hypothetical protein XI06_24605 [Bradyrhizobium sp. CCBAU 11434]|nr:hypothetical protein [Bradyrhizobium sp. CCBAU 11434]
MTGSADMTAAWAVTAIALGTIFVGHRKPHQTVTHEQGNAQLRAIAQCLMNAMHGVERDQVHDACLASRRSAEPLR